MDAVSHLREPRRGGVVRGFFKFVLPIIIVSAVIGLALSPARPKVVHLVLGAATTNAAKKHATAPVKPLVPAQTGGVNNVATPKPMATMPKATTTTTSTTSTTSTTMKPAANAANPTPGAGGMATNASFEQGTTGWAAFPTDGSVTLSTVQPGHTGANAVQVMNVSNHQVGSCTLTDAPTIVKKTQNGTYTVSAFVKGVPGSTISVGVSEYLSGVSIDGVINKIQATNAFQQLTVTYKPATTDSELDINFFTSNSGPGLCFQADDVSVTFA